MDSPAEPRRGDFLDQIIADMDKEKFPNWRFFCRSDLQNSIRQLRVYFGSTDAIPEVNRRPSFSARGVDSKSLQFISTI
ncbi:hypothetical protein OIU78_001308 [Salix suchowensis]|nr:hypothetical protein OIU78_001308 [Salix suchowensis]